MQEADFNLNDFQEGNHAADAKLAIRFFVKAKQDAEASAEAGRPIFKEVDYIQVMVPGDRNHVVIRPVSFQDKHRFSRQYEHWKQTSSNDVVVGTPLEAWNTLSISQIEEFKFFGVRTIENMAELRDDITAKIPGASTLKQKAAQFIAIAKDEAPMKKFQTEIDKRDNIIATMQKAIDDQAVILKQLQDAAKQNNGRR